MNVELVNCLGYVTQLRGQAVLYLLVVGSNPAY